MADLLNCPFCGGEAEIKRQGTPRVSMLYACTECGCELETGETGTAYLMWNRRVAQQDQDSDSREGELGPQLHNIENVPSMGAVLKEEFFPSASVTSGYMQAPVEPSPIVSPHSEGVFPKIERCHADRDGDCNHPNCPQLRDGEPAKTGRHCPIDTWHEVDEE